MKKWLLGILIIILLIVLFLPYGMGFIIKKQYTRLINSAQTPRAKVSLLSYNRGWYTSTATLQVTIKSPLLFSQQKKLNQRQPIQFTVDEHIDHGPVIVALDQNAKRRVMFGQAYILGIVTKPYISGFVSTLIRINGKVDNNITINNLMLGNKQTGYTFSMRNAQAYITLPANFNKRETHIIIAAMDIYAQGMQQHLDDITVNSYLNKSKSGLLLGQTQAKVQTFAGLINNQAQFKINNVALNIEGHEINAKANYLVTLSTDNALIAGSDFGPTHLQVAISQLDAPTLAKLQNELQSMPTVSQLSSTQLKQYQNLIMGLFSKGITIDIKKLDFAVPSGKVSANATFQLYPQSRLINNPLLFLASLDVSANVNLPKLLVQQIAEKAISRAETQEKQPATTDPQTIAKEQVADLVKQGILISEGDNFKIAVRFNQMQLLINGKPLNKIKQQLIKPSGVEPKKEKK